MRALKKFENMSVQAKATIWFIICSFLQRGISFITVPIFTRVLTTEQYGTYSLYLSWLQIITIITTLNLHNGVFDNGMSKFDDDRDKYIAAMQGLTITFTTIVFVVYAAASNFWSNLIGLAPIYILMMFAEMAAKPALSFWSGKQRFEYKYKRLVFVTLAKSLANPLLGLVFVFTFADKAFGRILSVVVVEVLFCGFFLVIQFARGKVFYSKEYWFYALKLAIPMLPHYLSGTVLNHGDRIMIEKMVSTSAVALYSVAYSIGMLVQMFTSSINSAITPWLYKKLKNEDVRAVGKTINGILLLVAGISICLMLVSPEVMLLFGSGKYVEGAYVVPPVAASVFFIFLYTLFSLPQFYYEKTTFLFVGSIIAAGLNVLLNYIFIGLFGYVAAAYTTLACYVLYSIGHYFVSKKFAVAHLGKQRMYDSKTILVISLGLIGIAISVNLIFPFRILRYAILFGMLLVAVVKRDYIIGILMKKKSFE